MHRSALIFWAILFLAGCHRSEPGGDSQAASGEAKTAFKIAVIPKGTTHVFWKSVHAGALRAARELKEQGIDVDIQWKGALLENDREGQINVVQDFVAQDVDGIVLAPLDATALVPSVEHARQSGIPTVIFDSGLADESATVSYVATDNYNGGALAAREIGKRTGGKGNVILLRYNVGSESTEAARARLSGNPEKRVSRDGHALRRSVLGHHRDPGPEQGARTAAISSATS